MTSAIHILVLILPMVIFIALTVWVVHTVTPAK